MMKHTNTPLNWTCTDIVELSCVTIMNCCN